jgi:hypothetical protein
MIASVAQLPRVKCLCSLVCDWCGSEEEEWDMQVQHGLLQSCTLDLGLPHPDAARLWQAASDEERQEALFGPFVK